MTNVAALGHPTRWGAKAVRKRVGTRGLSAFLARAMRHELEHEQLGSCLAEMHEQLGLVPKKILAAASRVWRPHGRA